MSFHLSFLSKEDVDTVIVSRANDFERTNDYMHALCPPDTQSRVESPGKIGVGHKRLEVQFVDGQGKTALIYLEEQRESLLIRGHIAGGRQTLQATKVARTGSIFPTKKRIHLHLRKDGILVVKATEGFVWLVDDKTLQEVWIEMPVFRPRE